MPTMSDNQNYYDAFSQGYDHGRDHGYHQLIDDQAAELVRRVATGRKVLEVGCGTGLVLERVSEFAAEAQGIDLSPGMLEHARARGLNVQEGSATELPFDSDTFDVAYSFKVLAHIPDIDKCLSEMVRVVRPGGHIVFDTYNRHSLRYLVKKAFGPRATSTSFDESAITTRFETPEEIKARLPSNAKVVDQAGIRIVTAHGAMHRIPGVAQITRKLEWALMDSGMSRYAGFLVITAEKTA